MANMETPPMTNANIAGQIQALEQQRNNALNSCVNLAGKVAELENQLKEMSYNYAVLQNSLNPKEPEGAAVNGLPYQAN